VVDGRDNLSSEEGQLSVFEKKHQDEFDNQE
jgi:hypothetical protein